MANIPLASLKSRNVAMVIVEISGGIFIETEMLSRSRRSTNHFGFRIPKSGKRERVPISKLLGRVRGELKQIPTLTGRFTTLFQVHFTKMRPALLGSVIRPQFRVFWTHKGQYDRAERSPLKKREDSLFFRGSFFMRVGSELSPFLSDVETKKREKIFSACDKSG